MTFIISIIFVCVWCGYIPKKKVEEEKQRRKRKIIRPGKLTLN